MKRLLVVANSIEVCSQIIDILGKGNVEINFVKKASTAIANLNKNNYNVIILDDKLDSNRGDTYDVGLELKMSKRNNKTPIICIGRQPSRALKLVSLLRPRAYYADPKEDDFKEKLLTWIQDNK